MEIKLVGTGGIFSPFASACVLIDKHILVDLPNGSLKLIRRNKVCITDIDTIFITHLHGDCYFDIPFLLLEKYKDDKSKIRIIGPSETEKKVKKLTELAFPYICEDIFKNLEIEFIDASEKVKIGDISVTSLEMKHGLMEAYGYIFKEKNFKIGFTGDTSMCESVNKMLNECNKVVIDTTFEMGTTTHLGVNEILLLLKKYPNTTIIPTHTSPKEKRLLSFQSFDNLVILNDMDDINEN